VPAGDAIPSARDESFPSPGELTAGEDDFFPVAKGPAENEDPLLSGEIETGAGKPAEGAVDELAEPGGEADTPGAEEAEREEPATARAGADEELTADGRRSGGGGVTEDEAGRTITDGSGRDTGAVVTTAVPRTARRGPINRAARLNTLRVAVS
jgi:hypothetical protein